MTDLGTRVVLGTVSLGIPYGRKRTVPPPSESVAFRILDAAWDLGIRAFDTAEAYGEAAERLRKWCTASGHAREIDVVTKCALADMDGRGRTIEVNAQSALERFDGCCNLVLLTHGAVDAAAWAEVLSVARRFGAGAGQSVYAPEEVRAACSFPETTRVQAPGNILDSRALDARADSPVPLDVRSVFLQGVLLVSPDDAADWAAGSAAIVAEIEAAAATLETDLAPLLIATVLRRTRSDDRVLVGVDDVSQLAAIPAAFEIDEETVRQFESATRHVHKMAAIDVVRDPRRWASGGMT